jgi:hypothetical protein
MTDCEVVKRLQKLSWALWEIPLKHPDTVLWQIAVQEMKQIFEGLDNEKEAKRAARTARTANK